MNVTSEPGGEHFSCLGCGDVQTRSQREALVQTRLEKQRQIARYRDAITRALVRKMPASQFKRFSKRLNNGDLSREELDQYLDECTLREHERFEAEVVATRIGAFIGGLIILALWIWVLFGLIGVD